MSGKNQHYIPCFYQEVFGIPKRRKEIYYFDRNSNVERLSVKKVASGYAFYSEPTDEHSKSLDNSITNIETELSTLLIGIRKSEPNASIKPHNAAKLASHLVERTAHIRLNFTEAALIIDECINSMLAEPGGVQKLIGQYNVKPHKIESSKLNEIAKDVFYKRLCNVNNLARDFHIEHLELAIHSGRTGLEELLQTFQWKIEAVSFCTSAVLPDCVALAFGLDGNPINFQLIGQHEMQALVLAVSPEKLLFGHRQGFTLPRGFNFNVEAVNQSHTFFLAPRKDEETARLQKIIGKKLRALLPQVVEKNFNDFISSYRSEQEMKIDMTDSLKFRN